MPTKGNLESFFFSFVFFSYKMCPEHWMTAMSVWSVGPCEEQVMVLGNKWTPQADGVESYLALAGSISVGRFAPVWRMAVHYPRAVMRWGRRRTMHDA